MDVNATKKKPTIASQIERLKKAYCTLSDYDIEANTNFENSLIGQGIEMLRTKIRDQITIIDNFNIIDLLNKLGTVLEENSQSEKIDTLNRKRNLLLIELQELQNCVLKAKQKQVELSSKLISAETERAVLEDLIKSTYEDNNTKIVKYLSN